MDPSPVVEFEDVCFSYGRDEVLHNVKFRINERDLVAVVGPNGGGKSTILKLILGLLKPQWGHVKVFGEKPAQVRRRIGYVPQSIRFDPTFPVTANDVVLMGRVERRLFGPYRKADRAATREALERVSLADKAHQGFSELSGGERQRILIAQALVTEPDLLLLDEPTANVDVVVEHRLYQLLNELSKRLTIVVVSHNLNVVTRHASHVACVNRTASVVAIPEMTDDRLHAVYGSEMTVLRHEDSCHVIDPSKVLHAPHLGLHHHHEE